MPNSFVCCGQNDAPLPREKKQRLIRFFYPARCACCNTVISAERAVCGECVRRLSRCDRQPETLSSGRHAFEYDAREAPFYYDGPVQAGLQGLKFRGHKEAAEFFGAQMARTVRERMLPDFDAVVYVPLSAERMRVRGYNQSRLLARVIAAELSLPLLDGMLTKIFENSEQHKCPGPFRFGNVFGVYEADASAAGRNLLLVDDISTSGATFNECAKMLKLAGARIVCCIAAAVVSDDFVTKSPPGEALTDKTRSGIIKAGSIRGNLHDKAIK